MEPQLGPSDRILSVVCLSVSVKSGAYKHVLGHFKRGLLGMTFLHVVI